MADQITGTRLAAVLWVVAAGLAFLAVGIRYSADREMNWPIAAGGVFCLAMAVTAWTRSQSRPRGA